MEQPSTSALSDAVSAYPDLTAEMLYPKKQIDALCRDVATITDKLERWMCSSLPTQDSVQLKELRECDRLRSEVQRLYNILVREQEHRKTLSNPRTVTINGSKQCETTDQHDSLLLQNLTPDQAAILKKKEEEMADLQREASIKQESLSREIERLRETELIIQENFTADLHAEKEKNSLLREELDKITHAHEDLVVKYETAELHNARLQKNLEMEIKSNKERVQKEIRSYQSLRVEKETLRQKMAEDMAKIQRDASVKQESLHQKVEQLEEAMMISHERFTADLKAEKDKNSSLSLELEKILVLNQELRLKCETLEQHAERLQETLDNEIKSHDERVQENIKSLQSLRAEKEALRQKMGEEMAVLERDAAVKQEALQREVEELKEAQITNQEKIIVDLHTEKDKNLLLNQELKKISCLHKELIIKCETAEHQALLLQQKLDLEIKNSTDRFQASQHQFQSWRAEKEADRQKMADDMAALQRDCTSKQQCLLREIEELKEAQIFSQRNFTIELKNEKDENLHLRQKLDQITTLHHELSFRCKEFEQQASLLQQQTYLDKKHHEERVKEDRELIHSMRLDMDALHQKMLEEIAVIQRDSALREESLLKEIDDLYEKQTFNPENSRPDCQVKNELNLPESQETNKESNEELSLKCETAEQQTVLLQQRLEKEMKAHADRLEQDKLLIESLRAEKEALHQKIAENTVLQSQAAKNHEALLREVEELRSQVRPQMDLNFDIPNFESSREGLGVTDWDIFPQSSLPEDNIHSSGNQDSVSETMLTEPTRSKWKTFRHALGFGRPKRWKRSSVD